ncbi:MAG: LytTR family transcriptional regulator [Eubacterium sp.]|nr:LytTR family transcriptional regulator [Eubacterium sp.]
MNKQEIMDLSLQITTDYYDNRIQPFLDSLDEKALWYGPAQGQFLSGKGAIVAAWSAETVHPLSFTLENIQVTAITTSSSFYEVMMSFDVTTHYPDKRNVTHFQRIHLTWSIHRITNADGYIKRVPKILMCVVTNPHHKHNEDNIYPIHYDPDYWNQSEPSREDVRMVFHTTDNSDYYLPSSSILWIESAGNSRHCVIHTTEGTIEALTTTAMIEKQYSDVLLRCHASYLVNPDYIRNIRRFAVTMADGAELPIPEKKYTSFKNKVNEYKTT